MITLKKQEDFDKMATAGVCVAAVHGAVRAAAKPGVTMKALDDIAAEVTEAHGCYPSFLNYHGFPAHICASPNSVIVHGIPGDYELEEGDILAIDSGAIFEGYHADAAFTMAIGEVDHEAQRLIDVTEQAMWAGIGAVADGGRIGDIGAAVFEVGDQAGFGVVREYVGHGIGRSMHEKPEVPNYGKPGTGMRLRTGMAICIEPMFNAGTNESYVEDDGWTVQTADGALSAHFEHTVALTPDGIEVLTDPERRTADLWPFARTG